MASFRLGLAQVALASCLPLVLSVSLGVTMGKSQPKTIGWGQA